LSGYEGHEGHYVTPHDHAWQVRQWKFVARCSGRYLCTTCWTWVPGERCDLAERERERAERRAVRDDAAARRLAEQEYQGWRIEPVGVRVGAAAR
jgi:hypothetical protein